MPLRHGRDDNDDSDDDHDDDDNGISHELSQPLFFYPTLLETEQLLSCVVPEITNTRPLQTPWKVIENSEVEGCHKPLKVFC